MSHLNARFRLDYPGFRFDVDCAFPLEGTVAVFGVSGSGKTTLLRCIAGLSPVASGFLAFGREIWQDDAHRTFVSIEQRRVGIVFQEARLFPHLNVEHNLTYGMKRTPPSQRRMTFDQVSELLGLTAFLQRRPHQLSGGEQRRVAIGRALVTSPQLLLMDEPLVSLDQERKKDIFPFIRRLNQELGIPVLYVTHDLNEIVQLARHVVLMKRGNVVATGPIQEVFARQDLSMLVESNILGAVIETRIAGHEPQFGLTRVDFLGRSLFIPQESLPIGATLRIQIPACDVSLTMDPPTASGSMLNVLEATIVDIGPSSRNGYAVAVKLDAGCPLLAMITRKSLQRLKLTIGQTVHASFKAVALGV